ATPAVTDGPGVAAGAARANFEGAHVVDPGDAAAAGADLDHVHDRQHHRVAVDVAADVVALGDVRHAVLDEARLPRGAAHVQGHDVGVAEQPPDLGRGEDAAHRARLHHR